MGMSRYSGRSLVAALLFGVGLSAFVVPADAAPTLQIQTRPAHARVNLLTGARGIDVDGTLYDVEFVDGTCEQVFGVCANPFPTGSMLNRAMGALIRDVFIDIDAPLPPCLGTAHPGCSMNAFDSYPSGTAGCGSDVWCNIITPFDRVNDKGISDPDGVDVRFSIARNANAGIQDFALSFPPPVPFAWDTGALGSHSPDERSWASITVWARWSLSPTAVPEPGTAAMTVAGLLVLAGMRRRRNKKTPV